MTTQKCEFWIFNLSITPKFLCHWYSITCMLKYQQNIMINLCLIRKEVSTVFQLNSLIRQLRSHLLLEASSLNLSISVLLPQLRLITFSAAQLLLTSPITRYIRKKLLEWKQFQVICDHHSPLAKIPRKIQFEVMRSCLVLSKKKSSFSMNM
jgi:hypothetical protein